MGWGDALMAAGLAQRLHVVDGVPRAIVADDGKIRWNPVWLHNPAVWTPLPGKTPPAALTFGRRSLPYLDHSRTVKGRWAFHPTWRVADYRPRMYISDVEQTRARLAIRQVAGGTPPWTAPSCPFVLIEPPARDRINHNRNAPFGAWVDIAASLAQTLQMPLLQLDHDDTVALPDIPRIPHATFREAAAIVAESICLVTSEGGLAHAAAATDTPAVVLWGPCFSSMVLGYPDHVNLVVADGPPCGSTIPCDHCQAAWTSFDPLSVVNAVLSTVHPPVRAGALCSVSH